MPSINTRRLFIVLASILTTFLVLRIYLYLSPGTNLDVAGYNIHHLFTGLLMIAIGGLPLALFAGDSRMLDIAALLFGGGLSMAMDEWVYLIATDGSDGSYLLPVSYWGAAIMIALLIFYILGLWWAWILVTKKLS